MEMEYHDDTKRRKVFIVLGVVLAVVAGGAAFFLVNQAQTAGNAAVATRQVVVAARDLPVRTVIEASDVTVRSVPEDPSVASAYTTPEEVVGRITGAPILFQQPFTPNLLTSTTAGSGSESTGTGGSSGSGGSGSESTGTGAATPSEAPFYSDRSTKISYQNIAILAKTGQLYIIKVDLNQAEEINHLSAAGSATFSMVLRPEGDDRTVDTTDYGETTNQIIEKYELPIPQVYPIR
jgi:Flp pilus assembly protein CpaB